jgi:hypothetical protein
MDLTLACFYTFLFAGVNNFNNPRTAELDGARTFLQL